MGDLPPRGPSLVFLWSAWLLSLVLTITPVAIIVAAGKLWHILPLVLFPLSLWAGTTGLLLRRLRPASRIARLFPEEAIGGGRFDEPASRRLFTILVCVCAGLALAVIAMILAR